MSKTSSLWRAGGHDAVGVQEHQVTLGDGPLFVVRGVRELRTSGIRAMVVTWARFLQSVGMTPAAWTATRISLIPAPV
jgi:hypothetical protein